MRSTLLVSLLLVCIVAVVVGTTSRQVLVGLSVVPNTPRLIIRFNLTNPSSEADPLSVLSWGTPMENGINGPIFEVTDIFGNQIPYIGKLVRRSWPPMASSYVTLHSRQTSFVEADLTEEFDFPGAGDYRIRFVPPHFVDDVTFISEDEVVGRLPIINRRSEEGATSCGHGGKITTPEDIQDEGFGSTNCDATQLGQIKAAVDGGIKESLNAYNCLNKQTCSALATRWFGAYSKANYDYDLGMFLKVYNRLKDYAFNAYCNPAGCGKDVYAYVYPTDKTYTVYLCGAFWSQANERINTVVHEMSHFSTLGGTDDYAYGKQACLNLAKSNPTRASHNADNVCYFSEEAPKL